MADEKEHDQEQESKPDFAAFGVVVERRPIKFPLPGGGEEFFLEVRAPDAEGTARIDSAGFEFRADGVALDDDTGEPIGATFAGAPDSWNRFLETCYAQVVDFCLPHIDEDGNLKGRVTYKAANDGRNSHNTAVYKRLNDKLYAFFVGAMDKVAGRTSEARAAFEELLGERP